MKGFNTYYILGNQSSAVNILIRHPGPDFTHVSSFIFYSSIHQTHGTISLPLNKPVFTSFSLSLIIIIFFGLYSLCSQLSVDRDSHYLINLIALSDAVHYSW